mgnify:CR=1 FL=1
MIIFGNTKLFTNIFKPQTNYTAKGAVIVVLLISLAIMREGGGFDTHHNKKIQTSSDNLPTPKTPIQKILSQNPNPPNTKISGISDIGVLSVAL